MANALLKKRLSPENFEKGRDAKKPRLAIAPEIERMNEGELHRWVNYRFKRPYAKKGWWWSGLWDPAAKNRNMVESLEMLFEIMSKKTYEEKHTAAKNEELEIEQRMQAYVQNEEYSHANHHESDVKCDKHASEEPANIIELAEYKAKRISLVKTEETEKQPNAEEKNPKASITIQNSVSALSDENVAPTDTVQPSSMQIKIIVKVEEAVAPTTQDETFCEQPQIIAEIVRAVDTVAQTMAIPIVNITMPASGQIEIFVEEFSQVTANVESQPANIDSAPENVIPASIMFQPPVSVIQAVTTPPQQIDTEDSPVALQTNAVVNIPNNVIFFPIQNIQSAGTECRESPQSLTAPQMMEQPVQEEWITQTIPEAAAPIQSTPQQSSAYAMPVTLEETLISESKIAANKTADPKKPSEITVFFASGNHFAKLKQTGAEAAPEE
jgi:hypothetical protein